MYESKRKTEAKYFQDEDKDCEIFKIRETSKDRETFRDRDKDQKLSRDLDKDKHSDSDSDSDSDASNDMDKDADSDSFDEIVYVKKPNRNCNKIRCEECNEELAQKNYSRHIQSLKHKKIERVYNRNKIIESANESGKKVSNKEIEQN